MSKRVHVKYRYYSRILMKLEIFWQIFKKAQISSLIKTRPVGAELFHADGWADRHGEANNLSFAILRKPPETTEIHVMTPASENRRIRWKVCPGASQWIPHVSPWEQTWATWNMTFPKHKFRAKRVIFPPQRFALVQLINTNIIEKCWY
jgi:hypothetical protein